MKTTLENITDEQIGKLADEAQRAGDDAMVATCEAALGCNTGLGVSDEEMRKARARCAEVIADAEAMVIS